MSVLSLGTSQQVKGARLPETLLGSARVSMLLMMDMVDVDVGCKKSG